MDKAEFGKRLRADMLKHGYTFRKLSTITDISAGILSRMTRGEARIYRDQLEKLAFLFGYPEGILPRTDGDHQPETKKSPVKEDYENRPKPYCSTCKYGIYSWNTWQCLFCHDTGLTRDCKPIECKEKGRWEPAKGKRKGGEIPWYTTNTSKPSKQKTKR